MLKINAVKDLYGIISNNKFAEIKDGKTITYTFFEMVKFVVIRNEDDEAKAYYTIKYDDKFKMYELYFSNSLSNLEGCPKYEFLLERSFENEEVIKLVLLNSDGRFFDLICKK